MHKPAVAVDPSSLKSIISAIEKPKPRHRVTVAILDTVAVWVSNFSICILNWAHPEIAYGAAIDAAVIDWMETSLAIQQLPRELAAEFRDEGIEPHALDLLLRDHAALMAADETDSQPSNQ